MGGRGSSMGGSHGSGGGGVSLISTPRQQLEQLIGPQSSPIDIGPAAQGANPNFAFGKDNWEYNTNCQRCIWAYEMRRRGYDVEAMPRTKAINDPAYGGRWMEFMQGAEAVSTPTQKAVEKQMASWGDGARAVVRIRYRNGYSGHVFIAERQGGKTIFAEPQAYKYWKPSTSYLASMAKDIRMSDTQLVRIDNLQPDVTKVSTYVRKATK